MAQEMSEHITHEEDVHGAQLLCAASDMIKPGHLEMDLDCIHVSLETTLGLVVDCPLPGILRPCIVQPRQCKLAQSSCKVQTRSRVFMNRWITGSHCRSQSSHYEAQEACRAGPPARSCGSRGPGTQGRRAQLPGLQCRLHDQATSQGPAHFRRSAPAECCSAAPGGAPGRAPVW